MIKFWSNNFFYIKFSIFYNSISFRDYRYMIWIKFSKNLRFYYHISIFYFQSTSWRYFIFNLYCVKFLKSCTWGFDQNFDKISRRLFNLWFSMNHFTDGTSEWLFDYIFEDTFAMELMGTSDCNWFLIISELLIAEGTFFILFWLIE